MENIKFKDYGRGAFGCAVVPDLGGYCASSKKGWSSAATNSASAMNDRPGHLGATDI